MTPRFSVYRWAECKKQWRIWDVALKTQVAVFANKAHACEVAAHWNNHPAAAQAEATEEGDEAA